MGWKSVFLRVWCNHPHAPKILETIKAVISLTLQLVTHQATQGSNNNGNLVFFRGFWTKHFGHVSKRCDIA